MNWEWNVFYHDMNGRKITTYNVFKHSGFRKDVEKYLKEDKNKEEFAENVRRDLSYHFRCRAEWEVIIVPWVGGDREKEAVKIDVYDQVMNNFDIFIDYLWSIFVYE